MTLTKQIKRIVFLFLGVIYFGDVCIADSNGTIQITNSSASPVVYKVYKEANASQADPKNFNTKDWEAQFNKQGMSTTAVIGNTMSIFGATKEGKLASSGDLSKMKTSELKNNPDFKNNKSIGAFDAALQNMVMAEVVANAFGKPSSKSKNIKCYITRDIGTSYTCTAPGNTLTLSSGMGGRDALSKLKSDCEGQCFTQSSCMNMRENEQNITENSADREYTLKGSSPSVEFYINTNSGLTIRSLDFIEEEKEANIKYTIFYIDSKGKKQTIVDRLLSVVGNLEERSLYIGDIASKIGVKIELATPFLPTTEAKIKIKSIQVAYHTNSQYICSSIQDISGYTPGEFANLCNTGKMTILSKTSGMFTKSFTICAQQTYPGQNADGSFYQQSACESICRRQYPCRMSSGGAVNFEGLKGFREGCIENTSLQCSNFNDDCKAARLNTDAKVLNEITFTADMRPVPTIVNGSTTGVDRPRLSVSMSPTLGQDGGTYAPNDVEFEKQKKEEWKDEAYGAMIKDGTWNLSIPRVGENTSANHAYGINLKSGSFYGYAGTSVRALLWRLKPAAFDVGGMDTFKMYAVVRAVVQNYRYDQTGNGTDRPFYDEIWYVKTSPGDTFKPFYYAEDAYEILNTAADYGLTIPSYRPKTTEIAKYATFSGGSWMDIASGTTAESFKNENFSATNAYWEYELLGNIENKYDYLPGIIRSITRVNEYQNDIKYDGKRDNVTAGTIVKMSAAVGYFQGSLTYQNIKEMVDSGQMATIYETGNENMFPRYFRGDAEKDNNVVLYMYGKQGSGSAYFNIRPREDHVGKKGFIYVYGE